MPTQRPNILLITTDQQSGSMMSCTGNPSLDTPSMDGLAANGLRFDLAYTTQPLCIPQRCSMYTGLMPHETGVTFNVTDDKLDDHLIMGRIFADAGYDTGYTGKWHLNTDPENCEHHGFLWTSNIRCNGADENIPGDFEQFLDIERDKPFLFVASFNNPHNICEAARLDGETHFADGEIPDAPSKEDYPLLPANFPPAEGEPSVIRKVQEIYRHKNYPTKDWDETRWRKHRWQYARMTEWVDRRMAEMLDTLRKHGLEENTLIVFTSDHGDGHGAHLWNQKQVFYDEAARIPFILSGPMINPSTCADKSHLVSMGLDLIPTLCDYAGIDAPAHLRGRSLRPIVENPQAAQWREHLIIETEFGTFGEPLGIIGRCVRSSRCKYMVYSEGEPCEHLVDMATDPGEMKNVAADPAYAEILQDHRDILLAWAKETHDAVFPYDACPAFQSSWQQ